MPLSLTKTGVEPRQYEADVVIDEVVAAVQALEEASTSEGSTLLIAPSVTPDALPSIPAITQDWDPETPNAVIRVIPHLNGSIIGGMVPGAVSAGGTGAEAAGEVRVIRNMGPASTVNQCALIILQDQPGSEYPFHLGSRRPWLVVPNLCSVTVQFDDVTNKWHVISLTDEGTPAYPRSIVPAAMDTTNVNDWDPVDATTGMSWKYVNWIRATGGVGTVLTGLVGPASPGDNFGHRVLFTNLGSGMTIKHASGLSAAGNKIYCPGASDWIVPQYGSVWLVYDGEVWWLEGSRIGGQ